MKSANFQSNQIFWICLWFVCTVIFSGGMVFAFTFMWFNINTDKILVLLYIFSIFGFFTCKLGYKIPIIAKYTAPHHKIGNLRYNSNKYLYLQIKYYR